MQKNSQILLLGLLLMSLSVIANAQNFTLHIIYNPELTKVKCIKGCEWENLEWSNEKLQKTVFINHQGETTEDNLKASKFLISLVYEDKHYHIKGIKKTKWEKIHCIVVHPNDVFIIDNKNVQMIRYQ